MTSDIPVSPLLLLCATFLLGIGLGCEHDSSSVANSSAADTMALGGGSVLLPGSTNVLDSDVPYIRTPTTLVDTMLALADVTTDDVVYDLGSGDGRIPIMAAQKYGARAVGIEIKPELVEKARANAREADVSDLVEFRQGDLFKADISEATVVTLYLVPALNIRVRPKLFHELRPGTRVVSHDFDMNKWTPDTSVQSGNDAVYQWTIPENVPAFVDSTQ
ncbi:MAG: SAM-dependent methyltransferase [Bacteroidetes bacterium SW_9_63_38]|nr:MAG: SAM-dependent methyltransferase [Bacteroidetes bacterium SW_9_63_38]